MSRFSIRFDVRRLLMMAAAVTVLACLTQTVAAQSDAASIIGQVTDESGAVLPGVTVTATSPALQVPSVVAVTNERGEYRLSPLPIGIYQVLYELSGFGSIRQQNIRLTEGFVAKLDTSLKVGALEEAITVSGQAPVVDVTSTSTTTQLTKEALEIIPSTRNGLMSLMAQAPGLRGLLDVGGSNFSAIPTFAAYGQTGRQWTSLEGVQTNDVANSGSGNYWDYSSFEETRVSAIGKTVEVPVRGVSIDAVVKSGGNQFHGSGFYSATNHNFQSTNIDDDLKARGVSGGNTLESQWDLSGDVGGRIIPNKLWFYAAFRKRNLGEDIINAFMPDGTTPAVHGQQQRFGTGKVSYQLNAGNRFIGFYTKGIKNEQANNVTAFVPWESRTSSDVPTATEKIQWQGIRGNLVVSAQYGQWYYDADYFAHADGRVSTMDVTTLYVTGDSTGDRTYYRAGRPRRHTTANLSWYVPNAWAGNHELKAGFDYMAQGYTVGGQVRPAGDYQLLFKAGVPFELNAYNSPIEPLNTSNYTDIFAADNWTIGRRLTMSLGVRFDHDPVQVPAQCREAGTFAAAGCISEVPFKTWNPLSPRLSVSYDLTGKGKTAIKAGWGRFNTPRDLNEVINANAYANTTTTYLWHDLNSDKLYQPGEVNLSLSGPDYVTNAGTSSGIPDPNEPQPKLDQYFASFEHELVPNISVRLTGVYANFLNVPVKVRPRRPYDAYNIPINLPDPGPDGKVGTADDPGATLTYWDYPAAYAGNAFEQNMYTSLSSTPNQTFKTIEAVLSRRLTGHWQSMASFSATKKHKPVPELAFDDPNGYYNTGDDTWEWIGRISGAYIFPSDVTVSANFENRSGIAGARTVLLTGPAGSRIPTQVVNAGPVGTLNYPDIHALDMRVDKAFRIAGGQKITGRLNVYNMLNANTITAWTNRSGASYLKPTTILAPRIFELSATYSF